MNFILSLLLIYIFNCIFCIQSETGPWEKWWAYEGISGPHYWGLINPKWMLCNKGKHQSPINIEPEQLLYDPNLSPISILGNQVIGLVENTERGILFRVETNSNQFQPNQDHQANAIISNQFHQPKTANPMLPTFSGGPLSYNYTLNHFVLHFGVENEQGSEHQIAGRQFTGELQLMAYNSQLYSNYSEAESNPNGLFALSLLIQSKSPNKNHQENENVMMRKLIKTIRFLVDKDENQTKMTFDLDTLLSADHVSQYITYEGSLTQPPCHENVIWLITNKLIFITDPQIQSLRNSVLYETTVGYNWRPIQTVYKRCIRTNIKFQNKNDLNKTCLMKLNYKYHINNRLINLNEY